MEYLVLMKLRDDGVGETEEESRKIVEGKIIPGIKVLMDMPALGFIEYREKTSKILVVTDQGFEVWKPKRRRTELAYTTRWSEVTDIWVDPRQGSYVKSTKLFLFTKDGDILLETKWPNMLAEG